MYFCMPDHHIITKKTETDAAYLNLGNDGIIRVIIKRKTEVNAAVLKKLYKVFNEIENGEPYAFIYYTEDSSVTMTEEGRTFAKEEENSFPKICEAVVVTNLSHKLLANFYLRFNKPNYPFKVFSKMEDAEKWCLFQMKKVS